MHNAMGCFSHYTLGCQCILQMQVTVACCLDISQSEAI